MGFGLRDEDWIYPDEIEDYDGKCVDCEFFIPCPCGCEYGACKSEPYEFYNGAIFSCPDGVKKEEQSKESDYGVEAYRRAS